MIDHSRLPTLLKDGEPWLMERILHHARRHGYTRYTSTLLEAWRLSIAGLTESIAQALEIHGDNLELSPEIVSQEDDPVTSFGRLEARKHRERGVSLVMFLGLFQYYRQSYQELLRTVDLSPEVLEEFARLVNRTFDRIEIAYCDEWVAKGQEELLEELQEANRRITNEKNDYLTVFESLSSPVILLDAEGRIRNLNLEAARLIDHTRNPGSEYYRSSPRWGSGERGSRDGLEGLLGLEVREAFPWLPSFERVLAQQSVERFGFHCKADSGDDERYYDGELVPMLDVSEKFEGFVVALNDVSERRRLADHLQALATTDSLTGVCNRRHFLDLAARELSRARRHHRGLSLAVMDVDRFKGINDRFGHDAGDQTLKAITTICLETLRASDVMGRLGGEEFGFVFPEVAGTVAFGAAERLVTAMAGLRVPATGGEIRVTVSIGVSHLRSDGDSLDELIKRADRALYVAKQRGRGQAVDETDI